MAKSIFRLVDEAYERFSEDVNDFNDSVIKPIFNKIGSIDSSPNYSKERERFSQSSRSYHPKEDAVLCLVVPVNRIDRELDRLLIKEQVINQEITKVLLAKSVYFLVCKSGFSNYTGGLNFSEIPIAYTEGDEIYIQIFIPKGEDTIGQDIQRIISKNLPDDHAIIQEVYLLNDLSNIDRFHRA